MKMRTDIVTLLIIAVVLVSSLVAAYYVNTDFGAVHVETVSIASSHGQIIGQLYRPFSATNMNPAPAVVLAHGISSSKQFLSGIALELARNGIAALTIDLFGHGGSDGQLTDGVEDATLGTLACVQYLESQAYVNSSLIGLVGHSLGAGAARATAVIHGNIRATVFIGGGFGSMVAGAAYGMLNATFPKNLLVAVGKQDVLFNLPSLQEEVLPPVFGITAKVEAGVLYGDFATQTARELITPSTTHLFEPLDPVIASKTVEWLVTAMKTEDMTVEQKSTKDLVFPYRDVTVLISLLALIMLVLSISNLAVSVFSSTSRKLVKPTKVQTSFLEDWKVLFIWGGLSLLLFFPMVFVGFSVNVPPVLFGSSLAWWMLATGVIGLSAVALLSRFSKPRLNVKKAIAKAFDLRSTAVVIAIFILLYVLAFLCEAFVNINLGIITPFFLALTQARRITVFFMFLPFFIVYFIVEGLLLHGLRQSTSDKLGFRNAFFDLVKVEGLKVGPFLAVLFLQYFPLFFLGYPVFSGFAGFLMEFVWLLPILFVISTACSWWFYRNAMRIGAGAVFNALIFAWIAAGIFPF